MNSLSLNLKLGCLQKYGEMVYLPSFEWLSTGTIESATKHPLLEK